MGELDPDLLQNQYMPEFLLERLHWIKERKGNGSLRVVLSRNMGRAHMGAHTKDGVMYISINHRHFIRRSEYLNKNDYDRRGIRNIFALALSHETLHLEEMAGNHLYKRPFIDDIEEEMFVRGVVYTKGSKPLIEQKEAVDEDALATRNTLILCGEEWLTCEEFREQITRLYKYQRTTKSAPLQEKP